MLICSRDVPHLGVVFTKSLPSSGKFAFDEGSNVRIVVTKCSRAHDAEMRNISATENLGPEREANRRPV